MHYVTDTKEIRDAKEKVTEAKENIHIANLEKDISGLNDILDDLDKKIEGSNKYYDALIENAENYWDSLIKGLEDYKSRWQELANIEEQAKMEVALRDLGITTDDVLNMSESAFESFKGTYLGLLNEMYAGNDEMINMLQTFGGISADSLTPLSSTIESVAGSLDTFAVSTGNADASISAASEILLQDVFQEWASQKLEYGEIQKQTFDRYTTDFCRFFNDSEISQKDIRKITEDELEIFIRETIRNKRLSNKSYGGLRLLIIGMFKYAKKRKYTVHSLTILSNFLNRLKKRTKHLLG